ncbi:MAG: hypothetical protein M1371_04065 [Actinobacteria bacterium]|nr:hypothetical protein [Actinomycetota bacterium]MCL5985724.1 hypothetical protein [Actinomycetota bacterium]
MESDTSNILNDQPEFSSSVSTLENRIDTSEEVPSNKRIFISGGREYFSVKEVITYKTTEIKVIDGIPYRIKGSIISK